MKTFESIIRPISVDDFLKNNWCKTPLFLMKNDDTVNDILTLDDISHHINTELLIYPFLRMVGDGKELDQNLYSSDSTSKMKLLDKGKILDLFNRGNTIVLQSIHLKFPKLGKFIEEISRELGAHAHANIYITPAHSKGFDPHVDAHEVFVFQVYGAKEWNLYDIPYAVPTKSIMLTNEDKERYKASGPAHEVQLREGDILYVPCGVVHDAYTTDSPSIHITIGVHPMRRIDILQRMVREAEKHAFFREACFPVADEFDRAESVENFMHEATKMLSNTIRISGNKRNASHEQVKHEVSFKDILTIDSMNTLEDIKNLFQNGSENAILNEKVYDFINDIKNAPHQQQNADRNIEKVKFKLKDMVKKGSIKVGA